MYEFMWHISIFDLIPLALNCIIALSAGLIFALFPDEVQQWQIEMKDRPGRLGRWLGRHYPFYRQEDRFIRTTAYITFLQVMGYLCILLAGVLTGFLVTYILRAG